MDVLVAIALVTFTGPSHQRIDINPSAVITTRHPRGKNYYGPGIQCLIHTKDGKYVAVTEDCNEVNRRLKGER